ncbi:hypothetical protein GCM10010207_62450 [Streptomyces atratus]|nr:hypothetical protein GCM10010207_62450 [Streptomyces atratus]
MHSEPAPMAGLTTNGFPQFLGEFRVGRGPGCIAGPRAPDVRRESALLQVLVPEEENSLGIGISGKIQLLA